MKYIVLFLTAWLFVGCGNGHFAPTNTTDAEDLECCIKTLTVRGIKHEYICYTTGSYGCISGMTHLPNCKYCETGRKTKALNE